jgi:hypothetical protein
MPSAAFDRDYVCLRISKVCACVRNRTERWAVGPDGNVIFIRTPRAVLVERLGKALRETKRDILDQPLPERWADLIKQLNAKPTTIANACYRPAPSTPERGF